MTGLHPGALLGLPPGWPHAVLDLPALRFGLVGLAWAWAALSLHGRRRLALLAGLLFGGLAVGFWILALGRPYGLFLDNQITRRAATAVVVAATGDPSQGFLAGSPLAPSWLVTLARVGLPPRGVLMLPTLLPLLSLIGVALLLFALTKEGSRALLVASLWLAFSCGDLDLLSGDGFLADSWTRPEGLASVLPVVAALLLLARVRGRRLLVAALGVLIAGAWAFALPPVGAGRGLLAGFQAVTLDQGVFLFLAGLAVLRGGILDPAAVVFLASGAALLAIAHGTPVAIDPWAGQVLYRIGLLVAACGPINEAEHWLGHRLASRRWLERFDASNLGRAALLAVAVPCAAIVWWNPLSEDEIAWNSREPLAQSLLETMTWIERSTEPEATVVASSDYSAVVAAVAGRRVVRAQTLTRTNDDLARRRAQRAVLRGRTDDPLVRRFHIGYLLLGPGDVVKWDLASAGELEARGLRPVFRRENDFVVFALPK